MIGDSNKLLANMKTRNLLTILVLLHLSDIDCNNIKIAKLLPVYGSNTDIMAREVIRIVNAIQSSRPSKSSLIQIILPLEDNDTIMPQIIEKTALNLGNDWLVTLYDGFCCDRYGLKLFKTQSKLIIEYSPDVYIIPLRKYNGLDYLDAQIKLMSGEKSFNPSAIFLLLTLSSQCGDYEISNGTTLYFDQMWAKNCMSSIILVLSECDFKISTVTATPFSDNNICRKIQENGTKQYHSKWTEEDINSSIYKTNHKNFNKCKFSVGTIPSPPYVVGKPYTIANETHYEFVGGIDLELLHFVSTVYNFTYVFDSHHGYNSDAMAKFNPNGSVAGIFIDLLLKNLDISVGGLIPHDFNYYKFGYSNYYKFSLFGWAVNDARLAPQWKIFFGAFSKDVWFISGFVFVIASFIYTFLDRFVKTCFEESRKKCIKNMICYRFNFQAIPLIQYFSISLSLSSMLKPKSSCLRVLYFSWSIYSLHMCIAYSSMLFLLISNPPLEKEITTVEDLKNSGLKVCSKLIVFQRFGSVELDSTTRSVMDDSLVCSEWESCIEDLIRHRNFSLLITQDMLEYYVNTKQSKVHRISEAFFSYGASVMTSKGNPLGPGFDKLILTAIQSGLVEKWNRDTKSQFKSVNNVNAGLAGSDKKGVATLTVSDLKGAFLVLVIGVVISSLLLFCEIVTTTFVQR